MFNDVPFADNPEHLIKQYKKTKFLNRVATTMYKVYVEDLEAFYIKCKMLDIHVDATHLDHDSCLTLDGKYGVEVLEEDY